jgi:hypothetical protein
VTHAIAVSPTERVPAVLPLALLEAVRGLDRPVPDALDEVHGELTAKRLGLSRTVEVQIERLVRLGPRGRVSADELSALLRLVARRHDASLVFSEAGRRAARLALIRLPPGARTALNILPRPVRDRGGFALAARLAERVLGLRLARLDGIATASRLGAGGGRDSESGPACAFYGAAMAELLRALTAFDGAMMHVACRARGDDGCRWRAAPTPT